MDQKLVLDQFKAELLGALQHLKYSYGKVLKMSTDLTALSSEDLESWEGFASRWARVSDIFIAKIMRARVLLGDPAFRGEMRDFVDQAEKIGLIDDADLWMKIREIRNQVAHEYLLKGVAPLLNQMRDLAPILLSIEGKLKP